ncbi:MAG: hypothetical protein H6546_03050 [Chitinophagales bacterium]|nr:hypothetical protein [Chitinophagales bacterium]
MPKIGKHEFQYLGRWEGSEIHYNSNKGFYFKGIAADLLDKSNLPNSGTTEAGLKGLLKSAIVTQEERQALSSKVILVDLVTSGRLYWRQTSDYSHEGSGICPGSEALSPGVSGFNLSWEVYFKQTSGEKVEYFEMDRNGEIGRSRGRNFYHDAKQKIELLYDEALIESLEAIAKAGDELSIRLAELIRSPERLLKVPTVKFLEPPSK